MPHATDTEYQHIKVTQLAQTFGAEVTGVDFSKPVEQDVFDEVLKAIIHVWHPSTIQSKSDFDH